LADLYMLDLDGLLVRTEELHFAAYSEMCSRRGFRLTWDFSSYCLAAHYGQERLHQALSAALPELFRQEPRWEILHREKGAIYLETLAARGAELQPGARELLVGLSAARRPWVVVTNSARDQRQLLQRHVPELAVAQHWVTREDYVRAKPHPDAYLCGLRRFGIEPDRALGLEDTPRGVEALRAAGVAALLVSRIRYPREGALRGVRRYPDLPSLLPELFDGAATGMA
jgi:HAD superfamily hydrolase (TIGR01509 family)